jgi:hypothetical protein
MRTNAELAQAKLLAALARPGGQGPIEVNAIEMAAGAIRTGAIFGADGARLGGIEKFQIDFVRPGEGPSLNALRRQFLSGALPRAIETLPEWRLVSHRSEEINYIAAPIEVRDRDPAIIVFNQTGPLLSFEAKGEIEVLLFTHSWSGEIEVKHNGETTIIDLYSPQHGLPRPLTFDLGVTPQRVEIALTGRMHPLSSGHQCIFGGFREMTGRMIPSRHRKTPKVRGAAFGEVFHELMAAVPESGLLLDLGGGNRQIDDSRYINADYAGYDEPDLIADATMLPLVDASINAVYSTGVFEHINNPVKAGGEVVRVLRPGGKAIIGWAFMQPIHAEGEHFFNATSWGVEQAFAGLKVNRKWYDTSFARLVEWGAHASGLRDRVPEEEIKSVCETLNRWDTLIPEEYKQYMAMGVWVEFEKP